MLYALYKRWYGDFDIRHDDVVAVSGTKELLKIECASLIDKRTQEEIENEVEYYVSDKRVIRHF
jgi:hypothetical protein